MRLTDPATAFSPDSVLEAARQAAGDGPGPHVNAEALRVLCAAFDADRADMHSGGLQRTRSIIVESLLKASVLRRYVHSFPEISRIRIERPLLIVSPPRTGTTFLHRLLAQDPQWRWTRTWEVGLAHATEPTRPSPAEYLEHDRRIKRVARSLIHLYHWSPDLARLHRTTATQPEESFGLLEPSLVSHSFMFYGPVEEYLYWLNGRSQSDWRIAFDHYAEQLRLLHWFAPGEHWLLKSPIDTWNIEALLAVFPDAHVVQIHRRPSEFLASFCHLIAAHHQVAFRRVEPTRIGRIVTDYLRTLLKRAVAARKNASADRFIDIRHEALRADPLGCVRKIYERAALTLTPEAERKMIAWIAGASGEGGSPRDPRPFQIDSGALDADFVEYTGVLDSGL